MGDLISLIFSFYFIFLPSCFLGICICTVFWNFSGCVLMWIYFYLLYAYFFLGTLGYFQYRTYSWICYLMIFLSLISLLILSEISTIWMLDFFDQFSNFLFSIISLSFALLYRFPEYLLIPFLSFSFLQTYFYFYKSFFLFWVVFLIYMFCSYFKDNTFSLTI